MEHAYKWILKWGGGTAFILIVAWPCLTLPAKVFSQGYFTFWVILSIIWGLVSSPQPGQTSFLELEFELKRPCSPRKFLQSYRACFASRWGDEGSNSFIGL